MLEETLRHSDCLVERIHIVPFPLRLLESALDLRRVEALRYLGAVLHHQPQRLARHGLQPGRVLVRPLRLQEELEGAIEVGLGRLNTLGSGHGRVRGRGRIAVAASVQDFWILPQKKTK